MSHMFLCEGCPHRSNGILNPSSVGCDDIHESFHQIKLMVLLSDLLGLVQMVELITLVKKERTAAVLVFPLRLCSLS